MDHLLLPRRVTMALSISLLSAAAFGQAPPLPGTAPALLPMPQRTAAVPSNLPGQQDMVPMQFPNAEVKAVLSFYEKLITKKARKDADEAGLPAPAAKTLVYDNQVIGTVNLVLSEPVPLNDAIRIIETNLLLNGFTLVPAEGSNIIKVIGIG